MSDSDNTGGCAIWIATTIVSIFSGVMAWELINPHSFLGAILFLFVWSSLSGLGHLLVGGLVAFFGGMK